MAFSLRPVLFSALALLPVLAIPACGSDEAAGSGGSSGTGAAGTGGNGAVGGAAGTSGAAGAAGTDGGGDHGVFGDLVPITENVSAVTGLEGPVNVVRDKFGMVHIYARHVDDAFRVQGWMMANDRGPQLELVRRAATGRLAEVAGSLDAGQIDQDITIRTVGLATVAQQMYDALPAGSETKGALDAFADGVSQWNKALQDGQVKLPGPYAPLSASAFSPWSPVDSLALGRLQTMSLSYDGDDDVGFSENMQALRDTFTASSSDPLIVKRAGALMDLIRFAPSDPATHLNGFPDSTPLASMIRLGTTYDSHLGSPHSALWVRPPSAVRVSKALFEASLGWRQALARAKAIVGSDEFVGSNNWAVMGSKSANGHAMVASDPHLDLSSPMIFWPVQLYVDDAANPAAHLNIAGLAFAGIPGIILGANENIAWGATVAAYDVTDAYKETLTADASGVMYKGSAVPFVKRHESVKIFGQQPYEWDVLSVPHHGPIQPTIQNHQVKPLDPAIGAFSIRWTGDVATRELEGISAMWRAKTVAEARKAMSVFGTGAQNWTFADSAGDVMTYSIANIPFRDKRAFTWDPATYIGVTPNMALDGASGDFEWTGENLPEKYVPKLISPTEGWTASANGDQIGTTLDNDPTNETLPAPDGRPFYLQGLYDIGYRIGRIHERLNALTGGTNKISADQMSELQGDVRSPLGSRLTPMLLTALQHAKEEKATAGTHPDLTAVVADARYAQALLDDVVQKLTAWSGADYQAHSGVNPDDATPSTDATEKAAAQATSLFNGWVVRLFARVLGDETAKAGMSLGGQGTARAFMYLATTTPTSLATYDAATGESALWDDLDTAPVESREERMVIAMLDALETLQTTYGSPDINTWLWGKKHTITFGALIQLWPVTIPSATGAFANGFPRHGDNFVVDACNYSQVRGVGTAYDFSYGSGPTQRFVAEMDPAGPVIHNGLPGGAQMWASSPFFSNEAELWRRNQTHVVPFKMADVAAAAVAPGGDHLLFR